jgi:hypothetical protein
LCYDETKNKAQRHTTTRYRTSTQKRGDVFDLDSLNLETIAKVFAKKGKKKRKNELRQAANVKNTRKKLL